MGKRRLRIYLDTSVFGGVFEERFAEASKRVFDLVRRGAIGLVLSATVRDELGGGPPEVQALYREMLGTADVIGVPREAFDLQAAYIAHGVVTDRWASDALHVATATVSGCDMIVSWNFRHIVNYKRIPLYNAVNVLSGYSEIAIYSPLEVLDDEEDL